jgi:GGDEF domain-containing protein
MFTAQALRQLVRPMDVLARITNDTFCLITYQTDVAICTPGSFKRLYEGLNHRAYKTAGGFLQVGVSITVSHAGEHDQLDPELMKTVCAAPYVKRAASN